MGHSLRTATFCVLFTASLVGSFDLLAACSGPIVEPSDGEADSATPASPTPEAATTGVLEASVLPDVQASATDSAPSMDSPPSTDSAVVADGSATSDGSSGSDSSTSGASADASMDAPVDAAPCPPGSSVAAGGPCTECRRGTYSDVADSPTCTPCANNFSTAASGSSSAADCTLCTPPSTSNAASNNLCIDAGPTNAPPYFNAQVAQGFTSYASYGGWTAGPLSIAGGYYERGTKGADNVSISWPIGGTFVVGRPLQGSVVLMAKTGFYEWSSLGFSFISSVVKYWDPATRVLQVDVSGNVRRTNGVAFMSANVASSFTVIVP